jgi:hypothetical protein
MAEATKTPRKSPDGRSKQSGGRVADRVSKLREQSTADAAGAREVAWEWLGELGRRVSSDREGALAELQEIFLCGEPATGISGQTEGILVAWALNPLFDRGIGSITNAWMPWLGKKFYPEESRGENTLTRSARWPAKLLWPLYSTGESPLGRTAFDFKTYVEAGRLDPSVDVLVIDYANVTTNPRLLIRQIRDELVQVVPGANLGKMLVSVPRRSDPVLGLYFALKSEI